MVELRAAQPGPEASLAEKEGYDPWESLVVQWDRGGAAAGAGLGWGGGEEGRWSARPAPGPLSPRPSFQAGGLLDWVP